MTILSREIFAHLLLKSSLLDDLPKDPSFLSRCWKILKVVLLQSHSGQFKQRMKASLLAHLSFWRPAIEPDLSFAFQLLSRNQYGESRKRARLIDFNTDWDICVNPQLRVLLAVSTLFPPQFWNAEFRSYFQWIASTWISLLPSESFLINEAAFTALTHLVRIAHESREPFYQKWFHRELHRITQDGIVIAAIQKEIEQWPLFSTQLQKLIELALLRDSLLPPDETPEQRKWHCYHFVKGGTIAVKNRLLFPAWTFEFTIHIDETLAETPLIVCSESESVIQFIKNESNEIEFQFIGENESVSFPCDLSVGSWTHFAFVVDSVTTVSPFFHSDYS